MGTSSLLGGQRAATEPVGRDAGALGPSDSSDSGSDMADVEREEAAAATDAAGTGERRSVGTDAGPRDGADISVDRVVDARSPLPPEDGSEHDDDEDPDLAFMDDDEPEP